MIARSPICKAVAAVSSLTLSLLLASGCSTTHRFDVGGDFPMRHAIADRSAARVGLYVPAEVRNYEVTEERDGETYIFRFGSSIAAGTELMLEDTFAEVVPLESMDPSDATRGLTAIVVPKIVSSDVLFATKLRQLEIMLRVQYNAYDPNGTELWTDTFQGEGKTSWDLGAMKWALVNPLMVFVKHGQKTRKDMETCMRIALEDEYQHASEGLQRSRWWEAQQ